MSERRKSVTTGRTNERTDSRSPIYPNLFLAEVYKSYQKLTLEILKKSTYLVKVPVFPLIPFHIKKTQITSPPKFVPVLIKFDTAHIVIPPAIQRQGGYIVYVRLSVSASLTAYAIPP